MNTLFPSIPVTFQKLKFDGSVIKQWQAPGLNMKARVVCKTCNETWMSAIESQHAKPAMADLISGKHVDKVTAERCRSISLFAFKTAVIANHMLPKDEEFFDVSERYLFRESLSIPPRVRMWFLGFAPQNRGGIRSVNVYSPNNDSPQLTLNVCSLYAGQFGFQVLAVKGVRVAKMKSPPTMPGLVIPFYPFFQRAISWPRTFVLRAEAFNKFACRWTEAKFE